MEKSAIVKMLAILENEKKRMCNVPIPEKDEDDFCFQIGKLLFILFDRLINEARRLAAEEKKGHIVEANKLLPWIENFKIGPTTQSLKETYNDGMMVMRDIVHAKMLSIISKHSEAKPTAPASLIKELLEYACECDAKEVMPTCSMIAHIASRYRPEQSKDRCAELIVRLKEYLEINATPLCFNERQSATELEREYFKGVNKTAQVALEIISDFTAKDGKEASNE